MANRPVTAFRLTPAAEADLNNIWDYTARTWSVDQAESYLNGMHRAINVLCENPLVARERVEITPPIRIRTYRSHIIIYRIEADHLEIIRITHMRQSWANLLNT